LKIKEDLTASIAVSTGHFFIQLSSGAKLASLLTAYHLPGLQPLEIGFVKILIETDNGHA